MNYRKVFKGRPDGVGFGEDPGWLVEYYRNFDEVLVRSDILRVDLSRVWFPLGRLLGDRPFGQRSRRQMADDLLYRIRFAEAGLAVAEVVHADRLNEVSQRCEEFPAYLRDVIFGLPMKAGKTTPLQKLLRRTFRVAWQAANCDEAVLLRASWDEDQLEESWERLEPGTVPTSFKVEAQQFDFAEMAKQAESNVRSALRRLKPELRLPTLALCQESLQQSRHSLTALLKAVYGSLS